MVERSLAENEFLNRYYGFVVYSEFFFQADDLAAYKFQIEELEKATETINAENDAYWYWARNFIMLAHAVGRDDLLENVSANELLPRMRELPPWWRENLPYLEPDADYPRWIVNQKAKSTKQELEEKPISKPEVPFSDWGEGPVASTPDIIWLIELN